MTTKTKATELEANRDAALAAIPLLEAVPLGQPWAAADAEASRAVAEVEARARERSLRIRRTGRRVPTAAPRVALPASFDEQLHVVVVDCRLRPGDLFGVIAHEITHCWVGSVQPVDQAFTSAHYQHVEALAGRIAQEPSDADTAMLSRMAREEELANVLPQ